MHPERTRFDPAEFADELAAAHENFVVGTRLLLENERVRVWDLTLAPGERVPFHRHRTSYLYRCHAGGPTLVRSPDGEAFLYESVADEVTFHPIGLGRRRRPRPRERRRDHALVHDRRAAGLSGRRAGTG